MKDAIIIGCGIVGATIAAKLRKTGLRDVLVIDAKLGNSGTSASAGIVNRGWKGKYSNQEFDESLAILEECWGLRQVDFVTTSYRTKDVKKTCCHQVNMTKVFKARERCQTAILSDFVPMSNQLHIKYQKDSEDGQVMEDSTRLLVMAIGANATLPDGSVTTKVGVYLKTKAKLYDGDRLHNWAPYRHGIVTSWCDDMVYMTRGSTIPTARFNSDRGVLETSNIMGMLTGLSPQPVLDLTQAIDGIPGLIPMIAGIGNRAYVKGRPLGGEIISSSYNKMLSYVVTGGGKMGSILAGHAAERIAREAQSLHS